MIYEISHQRLNFRFLKDYLLWRACEKPYSQTSRIKIQKITFIMADKMKLVHNRKIT